MQEAKKEEIPKFEDSEFLIPKERKKITPFSIMDTIRAKFGSKEKEGVQRKKNIYKNKIDVSLPFLYKTVSAFNLPFHISVLIFQKWFARSNKVANIDRDWYLHTNTTNFFWRQRVIVMDFIWFFRFEKCYIIYFRTVFPIWMEMPESKEWKALRSACFCYNEINKLKCAEHFVKYIFQMKTMDQVKKYSIYFSLSGWKRISVE